MEASPSGRSEGNPSPTVPSLTPRSRPTSRAATSCASSRFPMPVDIEDEDEFNEDEEMGIGDLPPPSTTPSQPRNTRKRSWTWEHFTRIPGNPENPQASCHHCGQLCKCHSKKQGTAVLIAHLQGCQRYKMSKGEADPATDQTKLSYEASTATDGTQIKKMVIPQYSEKLVRDMLAEMIIEDEMPFTTVDKRGFRKFVKTIEPRFPLPSRYTVMRDCMKKHAKEKAEMKKMFTTTSQRVSFTTDTWTSIQNISYMCITAHYIDSEWQLRKRIIGFKEIIDHKGASIGALMDDCLKDWGIQKVLCISVDNASANDTAIEWFKRNTSMKADVIRNHEFIHVRCCAHILNLIVSEGLKEVDDSITRVRNIVRYVRASPQRLSKFKAIASQLGISCSKTLCLDVPTRWNSTYLMLDVAQKYQAAFERMEVEDGALKYALLEPAGKGLGAPDTHDWTSVGHFVRFLQVFYDMTMRISGSAYTTANLFFSELSELHYHLQEGCTGSCGLLSGMAMRMQAKYDKYWGDVEKINRLLFVAVILDPRYKLALIEFWANSTMGAVKAARFITALKQDLDDLYSHYNNIGQPSSAVGTSHSRPTPLFDDRSSDDSSNPPRRGYTIMNQYHQLIATRNIMQCTSEIERYFMEEVEAPSESFQLLTWWKVNSTKYQILSRIARDVMAIPITTVASESAFSTGGRVLDSYQSSLSPSTVEALVCTQNWLSDTPIGLDTIGFDVDSYKLESGNFVRVFQFFYLILFIIS
ncbi:hypothetical protein I3760_05G238000 [Carya illinoinensis]|nr:hypothetical protein I3760_05G238000 [Carya illinoinensis]